LAHALNADGIGMVIIDTLGTGSSPVDLNGQLISQHLTAQANAQVLRQVREGLLAGTLYEGAVPLSSDDLWLGAIGHSMGGFQLTVLAAVLQEQGTPLDGAIVVGWSNLLVDLSPFGINLERIWSQASEQEGYLRMPRAPFRPLFYGRTVPSTLIEIDEQESTVIPKALLFNGSTPGIVAAEAAKLTCPILHILARHDLGTGNVHAEAAFYRASPFVSTFLLHGAAHCNFEQERTTYWHIVSIWIRGLSEAEAL
jgi:pimeloyl-ACP methyl ester carboxylesterase